MSKSIIGSSIPGKHTADVDDIKIGIAELKKKKMRLLAGNGYPCNYLELIYECPICDDKGFVYDENGSSPCTCYRQSVIDELYKKSNIDTSGEFSFEKFNYNYYPDYIDEARYDINISPRKNIISIVKDCKNFVYNFESKDVKSILLWGAAGVGKTFLCGCMANALIARGIPVLYLSSTSLFKIINEARMKNLDQGNNTEYETIMNIEVLIIDDLGTESQTESRYAELLELLNTREANNRMYSCKTIFSTNLSVKELFSRYGERIGSRIAGSFNIYRLIGDDIRIIKKQKESS